MMDDQQIIQSRQHQCQVDRIDQFGIPLNQSFVVMLIFFDGIIQPRKLIDFEFKLLPVLIQIIQIITAQKLTVFAKPVFFGHLDGIGLACTGIVVIPIVEKQFRTWTIDQALQAGSSQSFRVIQVWNV